MEIRDIESVLEGILFASGEPVATSRIALCLGIDETEVVEAATRLRDNYVYERRGIRLVFLDKAIQLCSAPEYADTIRLTLETRRQPQLSQQALEVLAIVAYFQPVTKTYIEQVRGVDSAYTVGILLERGLIEACGRLAVPGRPMQFRTTATFLRTFGLSSLEELPELPDPESAVNPENLVLTEFQGTSGPAGFEDTEQADAADPTADTQPTSDTQPTGNVQPNGAVGGAS